MAHNPIQTSSPSQTGPGWTRVLMPSQRYGQFLETGLPAVDQRAIDMSCQEMATDDQGFANGLLLRVAFATTEADYPRLSFL